MNNEPEIMVKAECDPLADTAKFTHHVALYAFDWRLDCSQDKRTAEADVLKRLTHDSRLERGDVGGDVGKFWHLRILREETSLRLRPAEFCYQRFSALMGQSVHAAQDHQIDCER
jgi:hypothetical protein